MSGYYFASNSNLTSAVALWFSDKTSALSTYGDISTWDVSNITSMYKLFLNKPEFNDDITSWDVGKVTNMYEMFRGCGKFNQDIGGWNTSNVTNMGGMFQGAGLFNQDIGGWDTGNVISMSNMFRDATNFNQNLTNWRVKRISFEPFRFNANSGLVDGSKLPVWGNNIVTNVTSSLTNGTYNDGDVIPIIITLFNSVTVYTTNGTPTIELETGTTNRYATYSSGSGTDTLTFNYTVQSGDSTTILEYASTTSLELNNSSGTLTSISLNLPFPGSSGSLSTNKSIEIITIPIVTNITSSLANGAYNVGQAIPIDISFSDIVNVVTTNGDPRIQLETGTTDQYAIYSSGSGSDTLTFNYTVQSGDTSTKLSYTSTSSLELNNGTIKDSAGNNAILTLSSPTTAGSLSANKSLEIYTTSPTVTNVTSSLANGAYTIGEVIPIDISFSRLVDVAGGTPRILLETGTTDQYATYSSGSGSDTLTFNYTVQSGDTSTKLSYTSTSSLELNGGTIKDSAGNSVDLTLSTPSSAGSLSANKSIEIDTTSPNVTNVTSSLADGAYTIGEVIPIHISFAEPVYVDNTNGDPRIQLETGATDRYATYSSGSGTNTLTFNYTVESGDTSSKLSYTSTTSLELNRGTIKDAAGNSAGLVLFSPGSADSLSGNKSLEIDTTSPNVTNVTSSLANGAYNVDQLIPIDISFSEIVNVVTTNGVPRIQLETGATDRYATYSSGSGSDTLTFNYTVQSGDTATTLEYTSTNSLELNSGTIKDSAGNNAELVLFSLGSTGSLSANKSLEIDTTSPILISSIPADNAINVAVNSNIVLTFSEAVDVETGNIVIKKTSDNSIFETIDVTSGQVTGTGTSQITINPSTNFESSTEYYVQIDSTPFDDAAGNSYAGISDTTDFLFETESNYIIINSFKSNVNIFSNDLNTTNFNYFLDDLNKLKNISLTNNELLQIKNSFVVTKITEIIEPYIEIELLSMQPENQAISVEIDTTIILTFSKEMYVKTGGTILIKDITNNVIFERIDTNTSQVSGRGSNTIIITPGKQFEKITQYTVTITNRILYDKENNYYEGTSFSFTTRAIDPITNSSSTSRLVATRDSNGNWVYSIV